MKIKSKLILAATSLLVLSGVAAGTSTFAWFSANQVATADITSMTVNTNTDSLKMSVVPVESAIFDTNSGTLPDSSYAASVTNDGNLLTDVSGPGVTLYKGSVDTDGNLTGSTTASTSAPNCFDFTITFSNTNPDKDMAVFLSHTSTITPTSSEIADDVALSNSMRVAILNSASDASLAYYAPNDTATSKILTDINNVTTSGNATASDLGLTTYTQNLLLNDYNVDYNDSTDTTTAAAAGYLGTIVAGGTDLTVVARIWLEGTDEDCTNTALNGNAAVNLVFNGVSNIVA